MNKQAAASLLNSPPKSTTSSLPKPVKTTKDKLAKPIVENKPDDEDEEEDNDDDDEDDEVGVDSVDVVITDDNVAKPKDSEFVKSLKGDALKLFNEIYSYCATNNVAKLQQLFAERVHARRCEEPLEAESQSLLIESLLNKRINAELGFCLLHLISQQGHGECVRALLENGADPAVSDLTKQRRVPYLLSLNKSTRDVYRRFMADYPNRYDYVAARISSPLSAEKLEKDKEKKKAQRKQKKQRDAEKKREADKALKKHECEEAEKKAFLALSDQQKRQLIVDRNFFNAVPLNEPAQKPTTIKKISRCWCCGVDMSTHVPFEYFDYKFCSTKCLNSHRQQQSQKTFQTSKTWEFLKIHSSIFWNFSISYSVLIILFKLLLFFKQTKNYW